MLAVYQSASDRFWLQEAHPGALSPNPATREITVRGVDVFPGTDLTARALSMEFGADASLRIRLAPVQIVISFESVNLRNLFVQEQVTMLIDLALA